jgi:nucleotide-binding universal stress UspA family protein
MRMLVAYDGSPSARRALLHAAALHREGYKLGVIHVVGQDEDPRGEVDEACRQLEERGITAIPMVVVGSPGHAICIAAERQDFDTIVVGRRNVRDAAMILLGSVASRVVAGAPCNVLVVA